MTTAVLVMSALVSIVWVERRWRRRARWHRVLHNHSRVRRTLRDHLRSVARLRPPRWTAGPFGATVGAAVGTLAGGPVAGAVVAIYGGVAGWALTRSLARRDDSASWRRAVDAVAALAAELRAGQSTGVALAAATGLQSPTTVGEGAGIVAERVTAAVRVAESSGAPLADVLERLENHLRAVDRARAAAAAQAAGARVSALLLAAMPLAGVGLGGVIGVDPAPVLFRTRLGAACLFGAVLLQLAGLAWATRLGRIEVPT
jgi:tight adherence protein B